jgi:hypothetical protein
MQFCRGTSHDVPGYSQFAFVIDGVVTAFRGPMYEALKQLAHVVQPKYT